MMGNKYEKTLINNASKLDALTDSCGEITQLVSKVCEQRDKKCTIQLLEKFSETINEPECRPEQHKLVDVVHRNLIEFYGYTTLHDICKKDDESYDDTRTLDELLRDLNVLVGLESVKEQVQNLISYQRVQKIRREYGLYSEKSTMHIAFMGNPGTGKTTVARIVGRIYKQLGLLSKGHFVEVSRTDLIAGYQGQTALKVKEVIDRSLGGVLFIDEAYSITENDHSDSYGRECLTELTKALEDHRDDLVVIVAGYTEPMEKFFESNPGLRSRFNTFIQFPDYGIDELIKILEYECEKNAYVIEEEIKEKVLNYLTHELERKDEYFGNARLIRNIFDGMIMNHAKRVVNIENPSREDLTQILPDDFKID
ncbi:AAA family ATPase [Streptococcus sp. 27098_8_73]